MLSQSYTDQRMEEEDFFDTIIKRAENNLIQTMDYRDDIGVDEMGERSDRYG